MTQAFVAILGELSSQSKLLREREESVPLQASDPYDATLVPTQEKYLQERVSQLEEKVHRLEATLNAIILELEGGLKQPHSYHSHCKCDACKKAFANIEHSSRPPR